jgi:hypothetical protein
VIELSGPADVTPADVAAALAELLGRTVNVVEAPLDAVVPVGRIRRTASRFDWRERRPSRHARLIR